MKLFMILAVTALALSGCTTAPQNLGEHKTELYKYQASGQYLNDVAALDRKAQSYILATAHMVKNPAIVLDIDETALSNWPQLAANDFGFIIHGPCDRLPKGPCGLDAWQAQETPEALAPTLALYNAARDKGVDVFFITGRDETLRKITERNLRSAGYIEWKEVVMHPHHRAKTKFASDFKAPERARIESMGYTIIATIGDQPSDLAGGYAMASFLVPNPFYRIP